MEQKIPSRDSYDVAICGAGLAGLTLARQIKRSMPDCSVALIDKDQRPLPVAGFKVGESTVEMGAYYLGPVLGLADYFAERHVQKLGLRFYFTGSSSALQDRSELGLTKFPATNSTYQIDRGRLEEDLRELVSTDGVDLIEGVAVHDVALAEDEAPHVVLLRDRDGGATSREIKARWVVDATGRRRMLQRKLDLQRKRGDQRYSSSWFRLEGRIDVEDMVPRAHAAWHARVPSGWRYSSTNHLMGSGYWIWIIPLATGHTSIGIVADEQQHPFEQFNTYPRAMEWLRSHEKTFADYLDGREPLDFRVMRKYSYTSKQLFSENRWACVGEAGMFADPFYSPGTDIICMGNTITTEMIRLERAGELTSRHVHHYNRFLISYNDATADSIQPCYTIFGTPLVMATKIIWDIASTWSLVGPLIYNATYLDAQRLGAVRANTGAKYLFLHRRMQSLFLDWHARSPGRLRFDFIDYLGLEFLAAIRARNLQTDRSLDELIEDQQTNLAVLEEFAQEIFLLAVDDVLPDERERFPDSVQVNPSVASLDPSRWEADGLFTPPDGPRKTTGVRAQLRRAITTRPR